jgi:hypothetical protein
MRQPDPGGSGSHKCSSPPSSEFLAVLFAVPEGDEVFWAEDSFEVMSREERLIDCVAASCAEDLLVVPGALLESSEVVLEELLSEQESSGGFHGQNHIGSRTAMIRGS